MVKLGKRSSAKATAPTTPVSNASSHTFLIAAREVLDGTNWQDDTVFSSEVITKLFGSSEWWQAQIDMVQLSIELIQDRLTDYAKLMSEHMIRKRRDQVDIAASLIEEVKVQIAEYKEWENICFGQLQKLSVVRGRKSRAPVAYLKEGGLPPG